MRGARLAPAALAVGLRADGGVLGSVALGMLPAYRSTRTGTEPPPPPHWRPTAPAGWLPLHGHTRLLLSFCRCMFLNKPFFWNDFRFTKM